MYVCMYASVPILVVLIYKHTLHSPHRIRECALIELKPTCVYMCVCLLQKLAHKFNLEHSRTKPWL